MCDMKCPFCQQELEDANIHSSGLYFECPNCYDKQKEKNDNYTATPKVWQELIRTRKALDVALCSLQDIAESNGDFITGSSTTLDAQEYAEMMLDKIKFALEQKDVK